MLMRILSTCQECVGGSAEEENTDPERQQWSNGLEFLMSCIAMSVGLGNIWRFPYTAFKNGGGAFLIPYIVVLFLIGKPLYYLEMAVGQFLAGGPVKVWALSPVLTGTLTSCCFHVLVDFTCKCSYRTAQNNNQLIRDLFNQPGIGRRLNRMWPEDLIREPSMDGTCFRYSHPSLLLITLFKYN
jgi:hypothetical protein